MKKLLIIGMFLLLFVGCSNTKDDNTSEDSDTYTGSVTSLSEKYLSKGYLINVYRGSNSLGDDIENYGKSYITMTFNVLVEVRPNVDFDDTNKHIKKKVVRNIRVIKGPKMGMVEEIYADYGTYGKNIELKGSNNRHTEEYDVPSSSDNSTSLAVTINRIALFDAMNYGYDEQPTTEQIYNDLGITRDEVALTLGFRIEYTTVDNKVFFKDYEIEMPAKNYDISGSEFQSNFLTDDTSLMESFLEKD
jgi:hypothetical protein